MRLMASECHREDGAEAEVEWIIRNSIRSSWARGVSRLKMRPARHRQIQGLNRFLTFLMSLISLSGAEEKWVIVLLS